MNEQITLKERMETCPGTWLFWPEVVDTITPCNRCHEGVHSKQAIKEFAD